ncbi:hypothetical protein DOM22_16545 [Bdellovibrio sp. ZAP7]|uniref:RCC1-like domain-containing protein n=1 Tax=Bdellovibrio sp. ZAP7 TaxID=2231053 RepID=UPI0011583C8F|nr:RCC1 domain-containing protein [Bdellovibrio sp. ZAP7]QDK46649.1 hypothetical protein DOM22_16545 [Bdellovibrio sp. ZAP7]
MGDSENRKTSRREFIAQLLASGATVQAGLWSSVIGALTVVAPEEADAQIFTHSFWKKKSSSPYYAWGQNTSGNLGLGNLTNMSSPTNISISTSPVKIGFGSQHAVALMSDGKLFSTGRNSSGQLGLNISTATSKSSLTQITTGPASWSQIAAGDSHTLGLDTSGYLWAFGENSSGQLGIGSTTDKSSPVQVSASTVWTKIAAGVFHSAGITSTGAMFGWGANDYGQVGNNNASGTSIKSPVQILAGTSFSQVAASYQYSLAISSVGALYGWGVGDYNLGWDGTYYNYGYYGGEFGESPTQIRNITGSFTQVSAGPTHALALRTDARLYVWGNAAFGQYGTLTKVLASPNQITGTFTMMPTVMNGLHWLLLTATNVKATGSNTYGEFGNGITNQWFYSPANVAIGTTWSQFALGRNFSLAIDTSAKLWAFGDGSNGCLGTGGYTSYNSPVQVSAVGTSSWSQVSAGLWHSIGIQSDGSLWAWGYSTSGGAGTNNTTLITPTKIGTTSWAQVTAGGWHNILIDSAGAMYGMGFNANGQLGINTTTNNSAPVQVTVAGPWKQAAAGWSHSIAIKTDGSLWTAGANDAGALGDGTSVDKKVFTKIGSDSWTQVTAAQNACAGIKIDGTLWAWGDNTFGAVSHLQPPTGISSPVQIAGSWSQVVGGYDMFLAKKSDGTYWAWGGNRNGNLGIGVNTFSPVQVPGSWSQIYAGNGFSAAVKTDSTLWVWGTNAQGELGLGDTTLRSSPVQIPGSWTLLPGDSRGSTGSFVIAKKLS